MDYKTVAYYKENKLREENERLIILLRNIFYFLDDVSLDAIELEIALKEIGMTKKEYNKYIKGDE